MSNVCPIHQTPWSWKEPGVSQRTGQPYSGFYRCAVQGCKNKPGIGWTPGQTPNGGAVQATPVRPAPSPAPRPAAPPAAKQPDWEAIGDIKMRCAMWCAWASGVRPWSEFWESVADGENFIKKNLSPGFDERALNERWADVPPPADGDIPF